MAVELPPPQAPQQVTVEQVKSQNPATSINVKFQDYTLHVIGGQSKVLKTDIEEVVSNADSLSNAVRLLSAAYYAAGYVGVKLSYALSGQDLYILVDYGNITSVQAPPEVLPYFEKLRGPLTDDELEPKRALASVAADRAGKVVDMSLRPNAEGTGQELIIKKRRKARADPHSVRLEIGNPGNRFVGRNFAEIDVKAGIPSGDEFHGFLRHGISQFNRRADASDYNEYLLGWNRVTPWGIFGLGYHDAYFDQTIGDPNASGGRAPSQGILHGGEIYWIGVLAADFTHRLTLNAKVDRLSKQTSTRRTATAAAGGGPYEVTYQKEFYNSLEIGGAYYRLWDFADWRFNWETGLSLRKGISAQDGYTYNNVRVQQDYFLARYNLKLTLNHPDELPLALDTWKFGFDLSTQYSAEVLPEQQQFVLGGANSLAAYLPGVAVGDSGVLFRLRGEWEGVDVYDFKIVPRVFAEYGLAKFETAPAVAGLSRTQSASDIAAELSVQYRDWLEVTGTTAYQIADQGIPDATLNDAQANYFMKLALKF